MDIIRNIEDGILITCFGVPFSLGPILLSNWQNKVKSQDFVKMLMPNDTVVGQVVRHVPFVVGIHLGPLTSKVVPIKTKI